MPKHGFSLVAHARDEAHAVAEWVAYHRATGWDHVYLHCTDLDPSETMQAVAPYAWGPDPFVTFRHWPPATTLADTCMDFLVHDKDDTRWFAFLDPREFLVLRGIDHVAAFVRGLEGAADCIYLQRVIYGHNGRSARVDGPTLTTYLRRSRTPDPHTRMICRSQALDAGRIRDGFEQGRGPFWLFLDGYEIDGLRARDLDGAPFDGYAAAFPDAVAGFMARPGYADAVMSRAHVAHFMFKSAAEFTAFWQGGGLVGGAPWDPDVAPDTMLAPNNAVYDTYLAQLWCGLAGDAMQPGQARLGLPNIARGKPSWQSSVLAPPPAMPAGSRLSGGGNNGVRTGGFGFHTRAEPQPWWIVDLLLAHRIMAVHVHNRLDEHAGRSAAIEVLASPDGAAWTPLLSRRDPAPFGGLDGNPLVARCDLTLAFRFVLLRLPGEGPLHLDEVEVFGVPA